MAFRSLALSVGFLVILWGCGEAPGDPRSTGGSSGSGGTAGTAGTGGTGGVGGSGGSGGGGCVFGCGGSGGSAGSGGTAGSGGAAGSGGSGGTGGSSGSGGGGVVDCTTSFLCLSCPSGSFCETNGDCSAGFSCIETGCDDVGGQPLKQCTFAGGGACESSAMCANGRECVDVPGEGKRCVKTTPGCDTSFDCVLGFACENGSCVDRRVPCDPQDEQCPKNHVCGGTTNSNFCRRIQQGCESDFDCVDLAPRCEDIDGDLKKECAGTFDPNDFDSPACTNAQCTDSLAPVCEAASFGTQCGQYGLCVGDGDCAAGFSCLGLWPDGRMECVPDGGSCSSFADCAPQQVCASPRAGGVPSCQAGL